MARLPGILGDIEDLAGSKVALELASELGGTRISLSAAKGSVLVEKIGPVAAAALVKRLGRGKVDVPMATGRGQRVAALRRREAAAQMQAEGKMSAREAALAFDIHERTAWRARHHTPPKLPLFDQED